MMDKRKKEFLQNALVNIPFDGWTQNMMQATAHQLGWTKKEINSTFPRGAKDLLVYFNHSINDEMLERSKKIDLSSKKIRERIAWLVKTRLELLSPYKQAVRQSLGLAILPHNIMIGPCSIWQQANLMWYEAGDTATDYNHYTKRSLLSGVIVSTTLYWLNDQSDNHKQTWAFLDRRIQNVLTVGGALSKTLKKLSKFAPFTERSHPYNHNKKTS